MGPKALFRLMRLSFMELKNNDPLRLAGATAFFTTFALPAVLIILIQLFGMFLNRKMFSTKLFEHLSEILGRNGTAQIKYTLVNFRALGDNVWSIVFGFLLLLFIATTLFMVIKNSLDQIWKIRVKDKPGLLFFLKLRGRSFVIILLGGLLFLISLLIDGIQALLHDYIDYLGPRAGNFLNSVVNELLFITVVSAWFTLLFRYLTDGRPSWRTAITGSIFTAVLFSMGKLILKTLLAHSNLDNIYGASGSIVLILLFVFYSSFIFYYGGCFINVLSNELNEPILPVKEAYRYKLQEIHLNDKE